MQNHVNQKAIKKEAKDRTFGCVGFPLYKTIPISRRFYDTFHMCENVLVVHTVAMKMIAAVLDTIPKLQTVIAAKPIDLPHWVVTDYGGKTIKLNLEDDLDEPERNALTLLSKDEDKKHNMKKGLQGT